MADFDAEVTDNSSAVMHAAVAAVSPTAADMHVEPGGERARKGDVNAAAFRSFCKPVHACTFPALKL